MPEDLSLSPSDFELIGRAVLAGLVFRHPAADIDVFGFVVPTFFQEQIDAQAGRLGLDQLAIIGRVLILGLWAVSQVPPPPSSDPLFARSLGLTQ